MATITGINQAGAAPYARTAGAYTMNSAAVSKDAATTTLKSQANAVGINSIDAYIKTDATGNVVGVDRAKLNADINEAKKVQKEEEKLEIQRQEEKDSFVKTVKGEMKKEEVKNEANKHKNSIDDEYKKALQKYAGITDKACENAGSEIERLQNELNVLKANKEKLMGSTATDLQIFEGAGKLLNKINKFFVKAENVSATEKADENKEGIFDIKSREDIMAEHQPINAGHSDMYENPFFKSAYQTTQKEANHKEFVA